MVFIHTKIKGKIVLFLYLKNHLLRCNITGRQREALPKTQTSHKKIHHDGYFWEGTLGSTLCMLPGVGNFPNQG